MKKWFLVNMKCCNGYNNFFACDHTYCFQQFAPKVEKNFIILHISPCNSWSIFEGGFYWVHTKLLQNHNKIYLNWNYILFFRCTVDPVLFENFLTEDGDLLRAKFQAFKFPETNFVLFKGVVNVCLDRCNGVSIYIYFISIFLRINTRSV